jgi:hypothetical protein
MFGVTNRAHGDRPEHRYCQCHGKDGVYHDRDCRCPRRCVPADELEAAVWQHVQGLLDDPAALLAQFEAFAREANAQKTNDRAEEGKWEGRLRRLDREEQRLVDAYQAEVIDLAELKERCEQIATRRQALAGQREQLARLRDQRRAAQEVWADLSSFCERVRGRLEGATLAERQHLLQLLIERVIVGEDTLEIRHMIPLGRPKPEVLAPALPDGSPEGSGLDDPPLGGIDRVICRHSRSQEERPQLRCRHTFCHPRLANMYMSEVTDSRIVGCVPFVDGATREVYEDAEGRQWAIGYDGERVYGVWLLPVDEPLILQPERPGTR